MDCAITVNRADLDKASQILAVTVSRHESDLALLYGREGLLVIGLTDREVTVPYEGEWCQDAIHVPASFLKRLAGKFPHSKRLSIAVQGNRLSIGAGSAMLNVLFRREEEPGHEQVETEQALWRLLWVRHACSADEIERRDLGRALIQAERSRDMLIQGALEVLAPLGVSPDDIRTLIERAVRAANEMERRDLVEALMRAERTRDKLIQQASDLLAPLGVSPADIRRLIDRAGEAANDSRRGPSG